MQRYGWLIYNAGLQSKKFIEINDWYQRTAKENGIELVGMKNTDVYGYVANDQLKLSSKEQRQPEFVLFLDKDIRLADQLERLGVPLFNSKETIAVCDDKITMYQVLAEHSLPLPRTIFAPMIFPSEAAIDDQFLDFVETELGYPLVIKEAFGSFGAQVYLIHNRDELNIKHTELLYVPHLFQQFITSSSGRDARIHIVGDQVVASMLRTSAEDFRANVTNGGKMEPFDPPLAFKQLAIQASEAVGADFSGVDLLFDEHDQPIICEVNSNAHIKNIYDCTGIDVTVEIFKYIKKNV